MSDDSEIRESAVKEPAGWTRLTYPSGNVSYRSPGGVVISNARFYKLRNDYKGQEYIPESVLIESKDSSPSSSIKSSTNTSKKSTTNSNKLNDINTDDTVFSLPEAKPKASRPSGEKATAKELSVSAETTLAIITSIFSLMVGMPELAMTDMETKSIAIPLANILEGTEINKKIGKMLANSGDYQLLGYALYLYGHRVVTAFQERNGLNNVKSSKAPTNATTAGGGTTTGAGVSRNPINLPYSNKNPGWVTRTS